MKRLTLFTAVLTVGLWLAAAPAHATPIAGLVATPDSYGVVHNQVLDVPAPGVLANDFDGGGAAISVTQYGLTSHGINSLTADGHFHYIPNLGYVGPDTFWYEITNGVDTTTAVVSVDVTNTAPVANPDFYSIHAGQVLTVYSPGVLANDTDPDGDPLVGTGLFVPPNHGGVNLNNDGSFVYTPDTTFVGQDSFWYDASDGFTFSQFAEVVIDVNNSPPGATDLTYSVAEGLSLAVSAGGGLLSTAKDADGDPITLAVPVGPSHGTFAFNPDGSFGYTPDPGFSGPDVFQYSVSDPWQSTAHAVTINVTPLNQAPVAADDGPYFVVHGHTLHVDPPGVLANDSDPDGDPLSVVMPMAWPLHGGLVLLPDGGFDYTADYNYMGPDDFSYVVTDPFGATAVASVHLEITDQAPTAIDSEYTTTEGMGFSMPAPGFLTGASDPDGDVLTGVVSPGPTNGWLLWSSDGKFGYTPFPGFVGDDTFSFVAEDGVFSSSIHKVTIHVVSRDLPPVGVNDSYNVRKNNLIKVGAPGVLANDYDPNGDPMTAVLVGTVSHGKLVFNADGSFTYVPTRGFSGLDSFTYKVLANGAYSNTVTVTLNVIVPKK